MTAVDLQAELERWINYNESQREPANWFDIIAEMAQQEITGLEIRQQLKQMGFVIDDYGVLRKRLP